MYFKFTSKWLFFFILPYIYYFIIVLIKFVYTNMFFVPVCMEKEDVNSRRNNVPWKVLLVVFFFNLLWIYLPFSCYRKFHVFRVKMLVDVLTGVCNTIKILVLSLCVFLCISINFMQQRLVCYLVNLGCVQIYSYIYLLVFHVCVYGYCNKLHMILYFLFWEDCIDFQYIRYFINNWMAILL